MPSVRVFVSYSLVGDEQGAECAQRFIADLTSSGAEVITDNEHIPDENLVSYLNRELVRCAYFVLIQTPQSLHSLRVQNSVNLALQMVAQQRMRGVLRLIATPADADDEQPLWVTPRAFDASKDYPRARDRILLELGLLSLDFEEAEAAHTPAPLPASSLSSQGTQLPTIAPSVSPQHIDRPTIPPWKASLAGKRVWIRLALGAIALVIVLGATLIAIQATRHGTLAASQVQRTATRIATPSSVRPTVAASATPETESTLSSNINPQSTVDPYGAGNTLALSNDLTSGNDHTPYQWHVSPNGQAHGCYFLNHTYDMSSQGPNYCLVDNTNFANFVYQIQMGIVQGQAGGIIFRANDPAGTYYLFEITTDGRFFVLRSDSLQTAVVQIGAGSSSAIHPGLGASNIVAVDASGDHLIFYVNAINVAQVIDGHYRAGNLGVIVGQPNNQSITEVAYTYARVWTT